MQVKRIDRIVRGEFLTVGEFYSLAEIEDPVLGAVLRLIALGKFRMRVAVLPPFNQTIEQAMTDVDHHGVVVGGDVGAVGRAAARQPKSQHATLARRFGGKRLGARQHGRYGEARGAEGGGAAHELAPRYGAAKQP